MTAPRTPVPARVSRVLAVVLAAGLAAGLLGGCGSDDDSAADLPTGLCDSVEQALGQGWQLSAASEKASVVTCQGHGGSAVLQLEVRREADDAAATEAGGEVDDTAVSEATGGDAAAQVTELDVPQGWDDGRGVSAVYTTAPGTPQRVWTSASWAGGRYDVHLTLMGPALDEKDLTTRLDSDRRVVEVASINVWDDLHE